MARDTNFKPMNELQLQVLYNVSLTHTNRHTRIHPHSVTHSFVEYTKSSYENLKNMYSLKGYKK